MSKQADLDELEAAVAYVSWVLASGSDERVANAALSVLEPVADYLHDHLNDVVHTTGSPNAYAMAMVRALNKEQKR
jgi:hypothetical protein